ncbi:MAG: NUDIX domain-containing protein, partial [Flavobacteriales bacterium]|nr:NUDIX domain-containing protein [Flavobacteriales bacterium]
MITRFNIRVYGILVHNGRVLVADERIKGAHFTKFPGGGLEFGEGTRDCLIREVREEIGVEAIDVEHFYTTDFFQMSAFRADQQIISIYYTFQVTDPGAIKVVQEPFDGITGPGDQEVFRWLDLSKATIEDATLP